MMKLHIVKKKVYECMQTRQEPMNLPSQIQVIKRLTQYLDKCGAPV